MTMSPHTPAPFPIMPLSSTLRKARAPSLMLHHCTLPPTFCHSLSRLGTPIRRRAILLDSSPPISTAPRISHIISSVLTQEGQILNPPGGVRVVRALSSESDSVTHSASPQARLPHVIPTPPTCLRPRCTIIAHLAPASLPPPHLVLILVPRLAPLLVHRSQASARLKTRQRRPCSLVCATSARHHSSCQPRVMHVVLDTSPSSLARGHTLSRTFKLFMDIFVPPPYVFFYHLYLRLVAPFF